MRARQWHRRPARLQRLTLVARRFRSRGGCAAPVVILNIVVSYYPHCYIALCAYSTRFPRWRRRLPCRTAAPVPAALRPDPGRASPLTHQAHGVVRYKRTAGALVAALLAAHRRILCTKEWYEGSLDGDDGDVSWLSSQRSTRYRDSRPPTSMGNPDPWNGKSSKACLTAPRGCRGNYWC